MKLKPCPFCGVVPVWNDVDRLWFICHTNWCFLCSRVRWVPFPDEWNRRKGFKVSREKMNK